MCDTGRVRWLRGIENGNPISGASPASVCHTGRQADILRLHSSLS